MYVYQCLVFGALQLSFRQASKFYAVLFQTPPKKQKLHDSYNDMNKFSHAWKKFPVLYDEGIQNFKFSEDFKGASQYIRQCYTDMATELGLSVDDVRKKRVKYVDGVTKGLLQLKKDTQEGTTACPIPVVHKLRLFRWLWPYSKNYDAALMKDVDFEGYMECASLVQVNKLVRAKQDATAARETLRKVRQVNQERENAKLNLKTALVCEADIVIFHDSSNLCVLKDVCNSVCEASTSICTYLPPSWDPTFHFAECGYISFATSMTTMLTGLSAKSVRKRSLELFGSLKASGVAAFKAREAVCVAQRAEESYIAAVAAVVGRDEVSHAGEGDENEQMLIQLNAGILQSLSQFKTSVCDAVQVAQVYVDHYCALQETAQASVPSCSSLRSNALKWT